MMVSGLVRQQADQWQQWMIPWELCHMEIMPWMSWKAMLMLARKCSTEHFISAGTVIP